MTRPMLAALSLFVVLGMVPRPSHADAARLEFTPVVAHLVPLNSQVASEEASLVIRQPAATAYGARLDWWVAPRVGIEAGLLVGSSSIELIGNEVINLNSYLFQYDARVRVRLNDPSADTGFDVIGGIGFTDLGDGLSDLGEDVGLKTPAKFTGIVGIGAAVPVTDRVRLRFDVEDHIHKSNFDIDPTLFGASIEDRMQHDLVIALGLVIPVWE